MATWEDVGVDSSRAGVELFDAGGSRYRSAVSRFYYAAFALLTHELSRRGAPFHAGRETPSHAELPRLVEAYLTQFGEQRRANIARTLATLYRDRLDADYSVQRIDKTAAARAYRRAAAVFTYLGVKA